MHIRNNQIRHLPSGAVLGFSQRVGRFSKRGGTSEREHQLNILKVGKLGSFSRL